MLLDRFSMKDKVAIVTGAGSGIGRGVAVALAEMGADVVLAARTRDSLEQTAEAVRAHGRRAVVVPTDVLDRTQLEHLRDAAVKELGGIDVLVNNAGGGPFKDFLRTSEQVFEGTIRFSLTSAFLLTRMCVPSMLERGGGSVVNISTAMARVSSRGFVAYATAKAGLSQMTRVLGNELAPRIRVNAIEVGSVETAALSPFLKDERMKSEMIRRTPMKRLGQVEDIALAALYLASPASSFVTGKILEVDGGIETPNWPIELPDL
ncbi:MAG: glucose 1-dehydrogenase [Polyangiales bacterium]